MLGLHDERPPYALEHVVVQIAMQKLLGTGFFRASVTICNQRGVTSNCSTERRQMVPTESVSRTHLGTRHLGLGD